MKRLFLAQLYYAVAAGLAGAGSTSQTETEPTSPKLDELKQAYASAWSEMLKHTDPMTKEAKDAKLTVWKIEGEMKAETAAIQKAANEAKIAEARNQRLQLNIRQIDTLKALLTLQADKKADPAKVAEAEQAFNTAKEAVDNELLAKYASSSPAKKSPSTNGTTSGEVSANKQAIIDLYLSGKTNKEIEEMGYKRSTVWHTINNYKKANEPAK